MRVSATGCHQGVEGDVALLALLLQLSGKGLHDGITVDCQSLDPSIADGLMSGLHSLDDF